ncbi:hypothetical protein CYMTET_15560 [Cymbomonas tetramitiformis]|uniref:Uncharacterized protein n=1 Tax=Cymbomonas tetramitiformis TaxID=36881 RepID=A0AAE0GDU2_9CHLO|nr:hypothetical protein CYMTET_15560 [Cymbomonas tetramitiformis]|eukprot:gene524-917_t
MVQPPNAQLLAVLENAIEFGKSIEKLTFRDDELGAQGMRAVMDMLAGYSKLKNLCLWRCRLGNAGVAAICDYLRGSTDKWSKMSPLRLLEITCDYDPPLLEPFPPPPSTSAVEGAELQTAPIAPNAKPKEAWSAASQEKKVTIATPPPVDMGYDSPGAEQKNIKIDLDSESHIPSPFPLPF